MRRAQTGHLHDVPTVLAQAHMALSRIEDPYMDGAVLPAPKGVDIPAWAAALATARKERLNELNDARSFLEDEGVAPGCCKPEDMAPAIHGVVGVVEKLVPVGTELKMEGGGSLFTDEPFVMGEFIRDESRVRNPSYYEIPGITWDHPVLGPDTPLTVWDIVHACDMNHQLGNVLKYIVRAGKKPDVPYNKDMRKAFWCTVSELRRLGEKPPNEDT